MKKKGVALLTVIIVMMVIFMMAAFMIDVSVKSSRINKDTLNKTKAYYSAEAGIYDFINYANDNNLNIASGTVIADLYNTSNGLFGDYMASYNARLTDAITSQQVGNSKIYTFNIYSTGKYSSESCIIVANVSVVYTDKGDGTYNYSYYTINSKKVYGL